MSDQSQNPNPTTPTPPIDGLAGGIPKEPEISPVVPPVDPAVPPVEPPAPDAPPEVKPLALTDLKIPEGIKLDDKLSTDFLGLLNDAALTPAARAQGLLDLQLSREKAISEEGVRAFNDLQETWRNEIKADPEIGGARYDATVASIGKLMDKYGDEETRLAFESTGAGNHPKIVKMFAQLAKLVTEPGPILPGNPGGTMEDLASKIYTRK